MYKSIFLVSRVFLVLVFVSGKSFVSSIFSIWRNSKEWLLAGEFSEFEYPREIRRFLKCARLARLADIRQAVLRGLARLADIRKVMLRGLARLADIRQAVLRGLARLAKGEFGKFYANLASLASVG